MLGKALVNCGGCPRHGWENQADTLPETVTCSPTSSHHDFAHPNSHDFRIGQNRSAKIRRSIPKMVSPVVPWVSLWHISFKPGESFQKRIRRSWTTLTTLHDIITVMFPYSHDIPLTPTIFQWNSMIFSYSYNIPIRNPIISHHICHSPKKSLIIRFIGFHVGRSPDDFFGLRTALG